MIILGLHMGHDAAVALVKEGKLIGTSSIERFTRRKKDALLDLEYIRLFLKGYDTTLEEVDYITFSTWTSRCVYRS